MIDKIRMAELTSEEARHNLTKDAVVLLPMGSLEDQGIHAPMGDYMAADLVAIEIAKAARAEGVATTSTPVTAEFPSVMRPLQQSLTMCSPV